MFRIKIQKSSITWNTNNKKILFSQQDYDQSKIFSIQGNFFQNLDKILKNNKKVEIGYQTNLHQEEIKIPF